MPNAPPILRAGRRLTPAELAEAARAALEGAGVTHAEAARAARKHRSQISRALNPEAPVVDICRWILEEYAGYTVSGPLFQLEKL